MFRLDNMYDGLSGTGGGGGVMKNPYVTDPTDNTTDSANHMEEKNEEVTAQAPSSNGFLNQDVQIRESDELEGVNFEKATPPPIIVSGHTSFKVREDVEGMNAVIDEFVLNLGEYYQPPEMDNFHFAKNNNHEFYAIQADQASIEETVNMAFDMDVSRVSFSTEELNLHNRLSGLTGVSRDTDRYVVIKTEKGDVIVAKRTHRVDSESHKNVILDEIKGKLRRGERVEINLLEPYTFQDAHDIEIERYRFRLALNEIKDIIETTRMRGKITGDCFLVIYE